VQELEEALQAARQGSATSTPTSDSRASHVYDTSLRPTVLSPTLVSPSTTTPGPLSSSIDSSADSQVEATAGLTRCQLGSIWYFKGVGILSSRGRQWISDGAGQNVFLERFNVFESSADLQPVRSLPASLVHAISLPAEPISRRMFSLFRETKLSVLFPILDDGLFDDTITRAYSAVSPGLAHRASAEACLWAMLALAGRAEMSQQFNLIPHPQQCVQQAERLLLYVRDSSSLDSLQAVLLLVRQVPLFVCCQCCLRSSSGCFKR
jgi:hypothetical protein